MSASSPSVRHMVPSTDGTSIAAYEVGTGSGQPVLLIHGYSQSHLCWSRQFAGGPLVPLRYTVQLEGHESATVTLTSESLTHSIVLEPVEVVPEPKPAVSPPKPAQPKPAPSKPAQPKQPKQPKPTDDFIDLMPVKPKSKPATNPKPTTKPAAKPVDDLKDVDISW